MPVAAPGTWSKSPQLLSPVPLLLAPLSTSLEGRPGTAVKVQMGNSQSGESLQDSFPLERSTSVSRKSAVSRCWECNAEFTLKGNFLVVEMELEDGEMPLHIFVMTESTQLLNCKRTCVFAY